MPGRGTSSKRGRRLEDKVAELALSLGLEVERQVKIGRRIWGSERRIDLIVRKKGTDKVLGIECKYQGVSGTAQEKIVATIKDMQQWPIPGIVVIDGEGFTGGMKGLLFSTGKVIEFADLKDWLCWYFLLDECDEQD